MVWTDCRYLFDKQLNTYLLKLENQTFTRQNCNIKNGKTGQESILFQPATHEYCMLALECGFQSSEGGQQSNQQAKKLT